MLAWPARAGYFEDRFYLFMDCCGESRRLRRSREICSGGARWFWLLSTRRERWRAGNLQLPHQDDGAVERIRRCGALKVVETGWMAVGLQSLAFEWASRPFRGSHGRDSQPTFGGNKVQSFITQAGSRPAWLQGTSKKAKSHRCSIARSVAKNGSPLSLERNGQFFSKRSSVNHLFIFQVLGPLLHCTEGAASASRIQSKQMP